ncbi:serine/threonine protein kinase [Tengunoibacter tsumagoiensis]|uniref:non-specific serine/threonine protein kinase n=1 Tax=Tengunoibacter tsumagoiensis TaxID=2014871 RepID=A0A402A244_9CHLR|nr:serine/threonine-protein kinase [Tengunoibacter tsumagoiensis]GCE13119.1 hypothetical protein KTT_29780 [Tengunoibacter tsumagoiensis]
MTFSTGHLIGGYRILSEIAHGAYASVYKAAHTVLSNRIVAIKILNTATPDAQKMYELFFQEARLLEQLRHPHILAILDANMQDGIPYIVKEYAPHGSLRDLLRQYKGHPLPVEQALSILRQAGDALQFVHQQRVVHCDLKPENILFGIHDEVLLADFDIAQIVQNPGLSASGIGGSPSYMAPEHFQGKVRLESDQYSLACIAYELFTGQRPFAGTDFETLKHEHLTATPTPLTHLNPELPFHIEQAVFTALAKKYTQRYRDVATFIEALDPVQAPEATQQWTYIPQQGQRLLLKDTQRRSKADDELYYEATVVEVPEEVSKPRSKAPAKPKKASQEVTATPKKRTATTSAASTSKSRAAKTINSEKQATADTSPKKRATNSQPVVGAASTRSKQTVNAKDAPIPKKRSTTETASPRAPKKTVESPKERAKPASTRSVASSSTAKKPSSDVVTTENALRKLILDGGSHVQDGSEVVKPARPSRKTKNT